MHILLTTLNVTLLRGKKPRFAAFISPSSEAALGWIKGGFIDFVDQLGKE